MHHPAPILLDGSWVAPRAAATREIRNPATLELLGVTADCGPDDVAAAVEAAARAQPGWWRVPGAEKAQYLRAVAQRIRRAEHELSTTMARETGKPLIEAVDCIEWVAACFDYYAEVGRRSYGASIPPVAAHQLNFTIKEPFGVVAAIVPFNFPLLLMAWKVAPALAAGNTLVCKPPHQNPLSNLLLARCFDALPAGVVNLVTGGPDTGEALVRHPRVDLIAFTGSVAAGRRIASQAGQELKKVNLELGSVDPFIVFADADLDVAVPGVAWARLLNAGQVCTSPKRVYLVEPIAQEFTRRLDAYVRTLRVGDPMDSGVDLGPLISREALETVEAQIARAVEEGARVLTGGCRVQPGGLRGHFLEPTILTDVPHGSLPTTEEIFGPVLSLTVARDADEAIAMANDSRYGLGASIYTNDLQTAMRAMQEIKAGTFWINDPLTDNDAAPFGGMRWSGIGRELGEEGLDAFREPKHVHLDYVMERKSYWYPYRDRPIPVHGPAHGP
ncbi:MAG TPA: aldehyde dehydrogenase family protein [Gemmatimonadales bacterium]|nr:aldehyde dehydrogenase family protein [Gemmatimonadales bacterium]